MHDDNPAETCSRCGRSVSVDADEFIQGEADVTGRFICSHCLTGGEETAMAEDGMAVGDALTEAGFDLETNPEENMSRDEWMMRHDLAALFYNREPLDDDDGESMFGGDR